MILCNRLLVKAFDMSENRTIDYFASSRISRRALFRTLAATLCGVRLTAQDQADFSADVKVVNVLATVRNKSGSLVGNLIQEDFALSEDGRPQNIRYFARESNLPLTLGMMVDTSGSQRRVLDAERGACLRFLDQVVRPNKDQVFIMQFDSTVQVRQALTRPSQTGRRAGLRRHGDQGADCAGSMAAARCFTTRWFEASDEIMKKLTGRKALIVLSDGVDFGSYGPVWTMLSKRRNARTR